MCMTYICLFCLFNFAYFFCLFNFLLFDEGFNLFSKKQTCILFLEYAENELTDYVSICCWDTMVLIHTAFVNLLRQLTEDDLQPMDNYFQITVFCLFLQLSTQEQIPGSYQ